MTCDPKNPLRNCGGAAGFDLTRPLWSFYNDPTPRFLRHDEAPPSDKPPPVILPPGPQCAPGFRPIGAPAPTYAPPAAADAWTADDLTLGAVRAGA